VPELLFSIRGSLNLIPLERTATVIGACERFIQNVLLDQAYIPGWEELDTLADAITSIEYHLERLMDGIEDNDAILGMAEQRLESLGFPPGKEPTWTKPEAGETAEAEQTQTVPSEPKERDSDLVDDEILEIFVEEADEVLETIRATSTRASVTIPRTGTHSPMCAGPSIPSKAVGVSWVPPALANWPGPWKTCSTGSWTVP